MTTTENNITKDMTPANAASLMAKLEEAHRTAWPSTPEAPWQSAEHQAGAETAAVLITLQAEAGMTPQRAGDSQDEIAAWLLNEAQTREGQAYARAFSDTAATYVRELRERHPLPEPDRAPGAPHPDPFLAGRGWHINEHGVYDRTPDPQAALQPEKELEAS